MAIDIDVKKLRLYLKRKKESGVPLLNYIEMAERVGKSKDWMNNFINGKTKTGIDEKFIDKLDEIWGDASNYVMLKHDSKEQMILESLFFIQSELRILKKDVETLKNKLE